MTVCLIILSGKSLNRNATFIRIQFPVTIFVMKNRDNIFLRSSAFQCNFYGMPRYLCETMCDKKSYK